MSSKLDFPLKTRTPRVASPTYQQADVGRLVAELEVDGISLLPPLLTEEQLKRMKLAFAAKLRKLRWNNIDGYQKTEPYRHMVEDVLLLDQGFVDVAIHPMVKQVLNSYLGQHYELTEAKGWKSLPTKRDFHGWHGDAWYDQTVSEVIPKEVKLAMYLTDVKSGAFNFIKGSHRKQHPRMVRKDELRDVKSSQVVELTGGAGTAFLFDTSGIHRQGVPMLEPRQAIFYNYHDPDVPLQDEDVTYYRYHPLLLNAAFLGNLLAEDQRILGFGNKTNFLPAFERRAKPPMMYGVLGATFNIQLRLKNLVERLAARLKHN
ncbi:MAG: phytanoyl-CoA dioxygenase family protein [Pyrinomonadaceae bacterium]